MWLTGVNNEWDRSPLHFTRPHLGTRRYRRLKNKAFWWHLRYQPCWYGSVIRWCTCVNTGDSGCACVDMQVSPCVETMGWWKNVSNICIYAEPDPTLVTLSWHPVHPGNVCSHASMHCKHFKHNHTAQLMGVLLTNNGMGLEFQNIKSLFFKFLLAWKHILPLNGILKLSHQCGIYNR